MIANCAVLRLSLRATTYSIPISESNKACAGNMRPKSTTSRIIMLSDIHHHQFDLTISCAVIPNPFSLHKNVLDSSHFSPFLLPSASLWVLASATILLQSHQATTIMNPRQFLTLLFSIGLIGSGLGSDVSTSSVPILGEDHECKDLGAPVQCKEWAWFGEW
jgi:hypothetical protein